MEPSVMVRHPAVSSRLKRLVDVVGAGVGLLVLTPIASIASVALLVTSGAPILFRHRRAGLAGAPFDVIKFRTMRDVRPGEERYATDEQRLTKVGRVLRKTSIDEIPQLLNVLKGEMSLVGPRPLLLEYLPHYTERQGLRHQVKPGLTGLAQIKGRNRLKLSERRELDVVYVEAWSHSLDAKLLLGTFASVIFRRGAIAAPRMADVDDIGFERALRGASLRGASAEG